MVLNETEVNISQWKYPTCSWMRRFSTVQVSLLPKRIYRVSDNPVKIPNMIFAKDEKIHFKIQVELQGIPKQI
jgi:hypothetical protein